MFVCNRMRRGLLRNSFSAIEPLERRQLLSATGYTTLRVANFATVGLKNPDQTIIRDSSGDIFGIASGGTNSDGAIWELPITTKTLTVVASFDGTNGNGPDGGLAKDSSGNIYGVCEAGGSSDDGTLWELPSGQTSITLLGSFNASTGTSPVGQLYIDNSGDIFGTCEGAVAGSNIGGIWEYNPTTKAITDLADFNGTNGASPHGGLVSDGKGDFFGTTYIGGASDNGTVWEYKLGSSTITALASFDGAGAGANPEGGLAIDSSGDLFGTSEGPANLDNDANVWELKAGTNTIDTLAFFPVGHGIFFGAVPNAPVILDSAGDVIGTCEFGGAANQGSVWAVKAGGSSIITLHSFAYSGGHDPASSLLLDSAGDIFGTTQLGGINQDGTAFVMLPPGNIPSTHLAFAVQPLNTQSNGTFTANVEVAIEGAGNRLATIDNSAVTLTIDKGPATATLGGTVTVNAVDGIATFTGLTLSAAGTYSLKATDGVLTPAISKSFMVPTAIHLVVAQQPGNETAGGTMTTPISIDVDDQFGKPIAASKTPVRLAIQSGPALAKLQGFSAPPVSGVATFNKLSATKAGTYTLTVSDGTATPLTLDPFTVMPAPAVKMIFSTQPVATTTGTPFDVEVELFDKYGNIATDDTSEVTLALSLHPAGAALGGTLIEPVVDGLADFTDLTLATAGTFSLLATDSDPIKSVASFKFAVTG